MFSLIFHLFVPISQKTCCKYTLNNLNNQIDSKKTDASSRFSDVYLSFFMSCAGEAYRNREHLSPTSPGRDQEVDFILRKKGIVIAIEVKHSSWATVACAPLISSPWTSCVYLTNCY